MDKRLKALLDGLKVPDAEWWNKQPVEAIHELGACIAEKADGKPVRVIKPIERIADKVKI